ncbi:MAG: metallopeptidase TldD-related protein [Ignavibacteria bacterium]|nr:metallopeptidase TldD-related protein [Ignavibacteria bacterium]
MRKIFLLVIFGVFISNSYAKDEIMQALRDEMNRSMKQLKIENLQEPYFIEYKLEYSTNVNVQAVLGNTTDLKASPVARLTVNVKVGDYKFDNSNYIDFGLNLFGSGDDEEQFINRRIPIELDYYNLRKHLWLATDAAYKRSVEIYTKKETSLKNKIRRDTTPDFIKTPPYKFIDTNYLFNIDIKQFEEIAKKVSSVFRNHENIDVSKTTVEGIDEFVYYINSEGTEYIKRNTQCGVEVIAATQCADGMLVYDFFSSYSRTPEKLPTLDSLINGAKIVAQNVSQLKNASTIDESYNGPILFIGQASAELFAQIFVPNLVAQRKPIMDGGFFTDDDKFSVFQNKIGGRVLPEFISVWAKPNLSDYKNTQLFGYYKIDDEGIQAQDLLLVENGYLKNLMSSRVPTRRVKQSNGHNRGGSAMFSNIILSANKNQLSFNELKSKLIKLVKARELPYGIIVKKVQNINILYTGLYGLTFGNIDIPRGGNKLLITQAYKLYPDGKEELVRGAFVNNISTQSFKDIIYVGKNQFVYNFLASAVVNPFMTGGKSYLPASIVSFDLLLEDGEIKSSDDDFKKPPILSKPVVLN